MEPNQEQYQNVEDYLLGRLSPEEKKNFESELAIDKQLQELLDEQKSVHKALYELEYERVTARAEELRAERPDSSFKAEQPNSQKVITRSFGKLAPYLAAAVLIGALFFAGQYFWSSNSQSLNSIVQQESQVHHRAPMAQRSDDGQREWHRFIRLYQDKQFDRAAGAGESLIRKPSKTSEQIFYTGLAHFYASPENPQSAIRNLEVVAKGESAFVEDAKWYLALALLQAPDRSQEDLKDAKRNLQELEEIGFRKYPVSQLLTEVNKALAN